LSGRRESGHERTFKAQKGPSGKNETSERKTPAPRKRLVKRMKSFFRKIWPVMAFVGVVTAAEAVEFRAEVDRDEIAQDESVSLKLTVEADGSVPIEEPRFSAPQFEEIQNYQGQFVQSYYDSTTGKFRAKFSRSFTFVL